MAPMPPLPEALWKTASPELHAAVLALVQSYEDRLSLRESRLNDLENRLKLNSTNSSKPPSSDPIGMKRRPPAPPQCKPETSRRYGHEVAGDDPEPVIHQVAELPRIEPIVDEYRLHRLTCSVYRATTRGTLPAGVPSGCFVPYLRVVLMMFAGDYRLSKRQIRQLAADVLTLSISTGMISKLERQSAAALEAPYNKLAIAVHHVKATNIDETSWRERFKKSWLWATVTPLFTVFTIAKSRGGDVPRALLRSEDGQVVGSDRLCAYAWIMARWRQICWAYLRRDFQAMIDRDGGGVATGSRLLSLSNELFHHWHHARDGTLQWGPF